MIWRHGQEMGVAFAQAAVVSAPDHVQEGLDLAARVERLETEFATMKRVLRRLRAGAGVEDVA